MGKILIAIDDSEHSSRAFDFYINNIRRQDDEVTLVHSLEVPFQPIQPMRPEVFEHVIKETMDEGKVLMEKYKQKLSGDKVKFHLIAELGRAGEMICSTAQTEGATMIIIGTRGMGSVRRTILGSVSDYVMHHAHCPVVVCRH